MATSQEKVKAFVAAYIKTLNATKAAKLIGYNGRGHSSYVAGQRFMARKDVQKLIQEYLAEQHMSAAEILARLAAQARGDVAEFLDDAGNVNLDPESPTYLIRALTQTTRGDEVTNHVTLHNAQIALVELAKIAG